MDAITRMKAYIHTHLKTPITLAELAREAGYSQFHTSRLFKEAMGETPFEYIRRQRLLQSAVDLRHSDQRVLDVALDYVFDSQEGFTRAFSQGFGISPKKFARYKQPLSAGWHIPYFYFDRKKTLKEDIKMSEKTAVIFTQVMERPKRKLIVKFSQAATHYFEYCEEVGCGTPENPDPWTILSNIPEALYEPVGLWIPENLRPQNTGLYAHGVEVPYTYSGPVPQGFDLLDLEPCLYMIFQGEPYDDAYFQEAVGICMDRIENFQPNVYGYQWAPHAAPRFQLAPMGWRGYIEGRPIVKSL